MSKITIPRACTSELKETVTRWATAYFGPSLLYDDAKQAEIDQWGLPWFRAGAIVRDSEGKILMMHEGRVQVKKIKDEALKTRYLTEGYKPGDWVDGDGGWNLPSGRLRVGESFEAGVMREVKEESGWSIAFKDHIHTRHSEKPGNPYILPVYLTEAITGPTEYRTVETMEIGWFTVAEIREMHAAGQLRSPDFVMDSLDAYEKYLEGAE